MSEWIKWHLFRAVYTYHLNRIAAIGPLTAWRVSNNDAAEEMFKDGESALEAVEMDLSYWDE